MWYRDYEAIERTYERGKIMTYDMTQADEIYREMSMKHDNYDHHLVMKWRDKMPEDFSRYMFEEKYGCHIFDMALYEEATSHFVNPDGSKGPHWSLSTIKSKSGITDFTEKGYTEYDYAYVVNMLFSDYGSIFTEPSFYLRMAKQYLADGDFYGNPHERAYHDAIERIEYFK